MQAARPDGPAYVAQAVALQDVMHGVMIEIAQHGGITCAAGFHITTEVDVQSAPGRCTVFGFHRLIYY